MIRTASHSYGDAACRHVEVANRAVKWRQPPTTCSTFQQSQ